MYKGLAQASCKREVMKLSTKKILISACLLGEPVRYDGKSISIKDKTICYFQQQGYLVPVCPEVMGGLPIPREPAEIIKGVGDFPDRKVITQGGFDVTEAFQQGAERTLEIALQNNVIAALLKSNSPSCGNLQIYDGSFSGRLIEGFGITVRVLKEADIPVFNELQISLLCDFIEQQG
ncbi:DUF523 domain-containing protein [Zooshikella ganghwensis]|uniref:DUF523 domain-containing protein n=1 Tax=Zooshikella ganghwensis TaxID=202772 RepID=UPI00041292CA|nr:DUF523 domain-containing protein [Zooshikella ganghwensis]